MYLSKNEFGKSYTMERSIRKGTIGSRGKGRGEKKKIWGIKGDINLLGFGKPWQG